MWQQGKQVIDLITDFLQCMWQYAKDEITKDTGVGADLSMFAFTSSEFPLKFSRFCRCLFDGSGCMESKVLRQNAGGSYESRICSGSPSHRHWVRGGGRFSCRHSQCKAGSELHDSRCRGWNLWHCCKDPSPASLGLFTDWPFLRFTR